MAKILIKNGQNGCFLKRLWPKLQHVLTIGVREGVLLRGRKKFSLKITICPKNKQFALKPTF